MYFKQKKIILPLLNVLKKLPQDERVILMSHLDDVTRDAIYTAIASVLRSSEVPLRKRLFLKTKLEPYKDDLRFLADERKSGKLKKKRLVQLGGAPIGHVLKTAIPLLLNLYQTSK